MTQDSLPTNPPSEAIINALKKLPQALKLSRNKAIEGRNAERAVRTAEHAHDPVAHPDAASDDESLITVSDIPMDALSPLSKVKKVAEKLSPVPKPATKKLREESAIPAGMNMPPRFSSDITELYMNLHLPLSLFTSNNLDLVNNSYESMATVKSNVPGAISSDKQIRVLDTASFERKFLAVKNMDRGQWLEAAQNFVTFLEGYWSDREHDRHQLRRAYKAHPFTYSFEYYSRQLMEEIFALRIAESIPRAPSQPHQRCERRRAGVAAAGVVATASVAVAELAAAAVAAVTPETGALDTRHALATPTATVTTVQSSPLFSRENATSVREFATMEVNLEQEGELI
ncbi:hypothetical protein B0H14DRAFT_3529727 [Mycena olivaceomarginata]|nr:hypothetical protein B0H14DRAFT_3529727 [Mycena olivaceomarginata]